MTWLILLALFVLIVIGALPAWPRSRGWRYFPAGALGLVILGMLVMLLVGQI